jgi:hypothetical protein
MKRASEITHSVLEKIQHTFDAASDEKALGKGQLTARTKESAHDIVRSMSASALSQAPPVKAMRYFRIQLMDLDGPEFSDATLEQAGQWLALHALCAGQSNSGRIADADDLSARFWARHGIDADLLRKPSPLWDWHDADLVVRFFDQDGQDKCQDMSAAGRKRANNRWKVKTTQPSSDIPFISSDIEQPALDAINADLQCSAAIQNGNADKIILNNTILDKNKSEEIKLHNTRSDQIKENAQERIADTPQKKIQASDAGDKCGPFGPKWEKMIEEARE